MTKPFVVTIYMIYSLKEYKVYVGKTEKALGKRWSQHRSAANVGKSPQYIHRAMRTHGVDSFAIRELEKALSREEGIRLEKLYICAHKSDDPKFGYNLTAGGEGVEANEATRKKTSETHKRLGTKPQGNKGRKFSPEWLKNMSEGRKGIPAWNKGKKLSTVHVKNLVLSHPKISLPTEEIIRLRSEGLSYVRIASKFNVSETTIRRCLRSLGEAVGRVGPLSRGFYKH